MYKAHTFPHSLSFPLNPNLASLASWRFSLTITLLTTLLLLLG